jgi:hypothetical protein
MALISQISGAQNDIHQVKIFGNNKVRIHVLALLREL